MAAALQLLSNLSSPITVLKDGDALQTRPRINIVEGSNVTIDIADDAVNYKTDIIITATGGGGSGSGTVTSVELSGGTTGLSFSGGPITSSGTITIGGTLGVANGGTGKTTFTPGYVKADGTSVFSTVGAIPGSDVSGNISGNASSITSVLPISLGGTNATTASDARSSLGLGAVAVENVVSIAKGGTGSTTASDARNALDVPTKAGSGATGTWGIDISGNAATVSNGVYTTGSYANPSWIASLAGGKVTGNISGNAANVTGVVQIANGGTGATTASAALNALGGYSNTNPAGYTTNTGTVTSVSGNGTVNGITLTGTVTSTGNITLGGALSGVSLTTQVSGVLPSANGGVPSGGAKYARLAKNSTTNQDVGWYGPYVINVKDYGATGNGSTDDTSAIQSAVSAVTNNSTLYFPAGTYLCNPGTAGLSGFTSKSYVTVAGDGMFSSIIKSSTGSQVLNFATSCDHIVVRDIMLNGGCTARKAGQQALKMNASNSSITRVAVINSGEYAITAGQDSGTTIVNNVTVQNCYVGLNFADGINFGYVSNGIISDNIVDGSDDDCIAVGRSQVEGAQYYARNIIVSNNICRARTDLATTWGRGIYLWSCRDVIVCGNLIENTKQDGIKAITDNQSYRPTRIKIFGNTVRNAAINSGDAVALYFTTDCSFKFNTIINPSTGSGIEFCDWQNLAISNNTITSTLDQFFRGIHATETASIEGLSVSTPFNNLRVTNNDIAMTSSGSNTSLNSCIRLNPGAGSRWYQNNSLLAGNNCYQAGSFTYYIEVDYCDVATKIVNNVCIQTKSIATGSNNIVAPITANNN